ncbi:hypothetical protein SVAN01_08868 [Stagonosporopsis vannaccii]|nr:hypothetical protein SVAN01_08868 [Stagonosporopsis vannaccii]
MLAIEIAQPTPFRKASIIQRITRRERPLEISSPIMDELQPPHTPRKLVRQATDGPLERISETPPTLPPLTTKRQHNRADSGISLNLPISQQFSRPQPTSPTSSTRSYRSHSSRSSTDTTCSTHSRVSRHAHATCPFPHNTRISTWDLFLPPSQVHALYTGFFPENMADEWFVFSEGPDINGKLKVHFHRAWTGLKVAELFVVMDLKGEGAGKIVGIKWNGSEQTSRMSCEEARRTIRGSCRAVLGVVLEGEAF